MHSDFFFDYQYDPSPDAEERLAQAWELILTLILDNYIAEQEPSNPDREAC